MVMSLSEGYELLTLTAACCCVQLVQLSRTDRHTALLAHAETHPRLHFKYDFHDNPALNQYISVDISCRTILPPETWKVRTDIHLRPY